MTGRRTPRGPARDRPSWPACAAGSTPSTGGSWPCSTSGPSSAAQVGRAKQAAGRRAVRDLEREREVLLRVALANLGPLAQADLLAIYRRLIAATRALEARDRAGDVPSRSDLSSISQA